LKKEKKTKRKRKIEKKRKKAKKSEKSEKEKRNFSLSSEKCGGSEGACRMKCAGIAKRPLPRRRGQVR
jgi:hypothetical protein